jgi:phosphonate ABC transporter ATP-binding protein
MPLIVERLTKIYPDGTRALHEVSFTVEDGEFVAIIGLSGAGKSTLLRCINRLIEPTSGRVIWNGIDITAASPRELRKIRRQIGMIFQQFNLVKRATVLTNVLAGRLGYVNPWLSLLGYFPPSEVQRAMRALERVGLADLADKRADELSGGQQQRVGIARALMQEPRLLLADEPTTALDVTIQAQILELMTRLTRELGTAVIIITHNLGVVARYADRVNVMYAGKIVESASAMELYHRPRHPYTLGLLRSVPRLDQPRKARLDPIEGFPPDLVHMPPGCAFQPRCRFAVERCKMEAPPLMLVGENHLSACWEWQRLAQQVEAPTPAS